MPELFDNKKIKIIINKQGYNKYTKISVPVKYGIYSEIETKEYIFQFNLNHEIIRAKNKTHAWLNPTEWLKRTMGNDWIYYSTGGYSGVFEAIGEYYLPNFQYATNSLIGGKPFKEPEVNKIVTKWHQILCKLYKENKLPEKFRTFFKSIIKNSNRELSIKSEDLFRTINRRISVMPPDARHVDYDMIPVNISNGCLYNCRFCRVKTDESFSLINTDKISNQIRALKNIYQKDVINYNSIFLGEHDALNSPSELIMFAAKEAYSQFNFKNSYMGPGNLFLFGSADALLNKSNGDFDKIATLPFKVYINVGLESVDQDTLDMLGKPLTSEKVTEAYKRIRDINIRYDNIEISSNFIIDDSLPQNHYSSFLNLVNTECNTFRDKGDVYMSPLRINKPSRQELYKFYEMKIKSSAPTLLYIIQRL
jgi:Radical SAM superfamily